MKHLDLFSGIGGFALAARRVGWETVGFCEIEPYCQKVLAKHWPDVPIHEDINVPGGRFKHIERACAALSRIGYTCWPFDVAVETRRHNRRRIWIIAHANSDSQPHGAFDAETSGLSAFAGFGAGFNAETMGVDDGLPRRVDRLRGLGNAIVPQCAELIFSAIKQLKETNGNTQTQN